MAEEKKKKGVTREERIRRSFPKGSKFVDKILKKDEKVGRDSKAIVAFPPQRRPGLPKQGVTTAPPKIKKETKPSKPKENKLSATTAVAASTLTEAQRQALSNNQAAKKTKKDPLAGKPRSIKEAKEKGQLYFFDKNGVKKLAVTKEDLKRTGLSLREYANKYAPKRVTKKEAEKFKKKAGGGMMKKKGYAGGGKMKKKGMAAGGKMKKKMYAGGGMMKKKMMKGGGKILVGMPKGSPKEMSRKDYEMMLKMNKMFNIQVPKPVKAKKAGGVMKKKGYAVGGAMKKKGMKKGGKTMKMRGGGLATRGTNFKIR
tara:strand:- start:1040 stop:1978 length:939 start_codon:yes stop_codon:yes gene_type:complete